MAEAAQNNPELRQKLASLSLLLHTLITSARTASLYKPGHPAIKPICDRALEVLGRSLAGESNLTLDLKAKSVVFEETELPAAAETAAFAATLHALGVGQVLLTNRLGSEGLYEFFKILASKSDDKNKLTDLQKAVQAVRIDGMQLNFVLSFVVTGEAEQKEQLPGQLGEEQIAAFIRAPSLPDFLTLLLRQNEELVGKEAEAVTDLLYGVLEREVPLEAFLAGMPWHRYDQRIRQRLDELMACAQGQGGWRRDALVSWAAALSQGDLAAREWRHIHERPEALRWSLDMAHALWDLPAGDKRPKHARLAYVRIVAELVKDGQVGELLGELGRIERLEPALRKTVQDSLLARPFAERLVAHVRQLPGESPEFARLVDFLAFMGEEATPLLLGELAAVQDKAHRAQLCTLLARLGARVGPKALFKALDNDDWFLVANVIAILFEMGDLVVVRRLLPLLKHRHVRVREAAAVALLKLGGAEATDAIADFVARAEPEETSKAVIILSLSREPGTEGRLLAAFGKTPHYATKVALVTALGRFATNEVLAFLKGQARRTWFEVITGRNKELRAAARRSLAELRKEGKV